MTGYLTRDRAVIVASLLAAHYGRFMMKPSPGSRPSLQARWSPSPWPARRDGRWQPGYHIQHPVARRAGRCSALSG
jgi:hypothetical protein